MLNIDEIRARANTASSLIYNPEWQNGIEALKVLTANDIPALCDEVERLRKECDELKKALEEYKNAYPDFYEIAVHNAKIGNEQAREAKEDGRA